MTDNEIIKALECCTKGTTSDVCDDCPLRTTDICTEEENGVLKLALDLINRQKAEIERLTAQRDKAVKDFEEFARIAFEIPFACKHCVHSVENGRACLWKEEHEDEEETCLGKHFEYRGIDGDTK